MADEPDMEFLMLLANVIVCLQLNFALYNTLMTSYRRQIAVLRSLRSRYENGSVDANRSMRFRSYENAYI